MRTFGVPVEVKIVEKSMSDAILENIVFYELSPTRIQVLEVSILMCFCLFLGVFLHRKWFRNRIESAYGF